MFIHSLTLLLPHLILLVTIVSIMLQIAVKRNYFWTTIFSAGGLLLSFCSLFWAGRTSDQVSLTELLIFDSYAVYFTGLILAASFCVVLLSFWYFSGEEVSKKGVEKREEFFLLLLLATLGAVILVASSHFASFFLGLEILSVSLYSLIAYERDRKKGVEAGLKYVILAGTSSAFLLLGMAWFYAELGTMEFSSLAVALHAFPQKSPILTAGLLFILVGIGFKLALVPFHLWTADVYEGAPLPVTAFLATVSKGSVFALTLRYFNQIGIHASPAVYIILSWIAVISMFTGNFLALFQTNIKRLLAYSSIAHLGYLWVALLAGTSLGKGAVAFYLLAYFVAILGAFGVIAALSIPDEEADQLEKLRGLFWTRPFLAAVLTLAFLSLAGIPFTLGFMAKFYLLTAGIGSTLWILVMALIISSAISLYYYLRVMITMMQPLSLLEGPLSQKPLLFSSPLSENAFLATLTLGLIGFGIFPTPLITLIQRLVGF